MKILIFLASLAFLAFPAQAQLSALRLDVRQHSKTDSTGKTNDTKKQSRSLTIALQNTSKEPMDGLVVKYWFFVREMKSKDIKILKKGERKSSIAPGAKDEVESENATSTYTEKHVEVTAARGARGARGGSNQMPTIKKIEASGGKLAGYAVRVVQGTKIVAEYYSEPSLKAKAH